MVYLAWLMPQNSTATIPATYRNKQVRFTNVYKVLNIKNACEFLFGKWKHALWGSYELCTYCEPQLGTEILHANPPRPIEGSSITGKKIVKRVFVRQCGSALKNFKM